MEFRAIWITEEVYNDPRAFYETLGACIGDDIELFKAGELTVQIILIPDEG